jgi:uncharacterized protein DUF6629
MCFSATVSFGASAVIGTMGVIAFKKSKTKPQRIFSMIPIFFAVQQFSEGLIWMDLLNPESTLPTRLLTYIFLFFAWIIWPIFIPFSMKILEQNPVRKKILSFLIVLGAISVTMLVYNLIIHNVTAKVSQYHIVYERDVPLRFFWFIQIFYLLATTISTFVSSVKKMWYLGVINIVSLVYSFIYFKEALASIWCFFAAVSSIMILAILLGMQKQPDKTTPEFQRLDP